MSKINISKREELVVASVILSAFMFFIFFVPIGLWKFIAIIFASMLTYAFTIIILRENIERIEYFTLPILPVLFTFATALFYGIIPERWLTRLIFISIYGFLAYSIFLMENVFNVAKLKNIQLLKVARTIYFFISSFTVFLFSYVVLSFHESGIISGLIFLLFIFLLSYTFYWSFNLYKSLEKTDIILSISTALIISELIIAFSFWPLNIYLISLFITSVYYSIIGVWDHILSYRLKGWNINEYIVINVIIFLLCILTVNFG
jgi:hypothetical protein